MSSIEADTEETANKYALSLLALILFWKMYFWGVKLCCICNSRLLLLCKLRNKHWKACVLISNIVHTDSYNPYEQELLRAINNGEEQEGAMRPKGL